MKTACFLTISMAIFVTIDGRPAFWNPWSSSDDKEAREIATPPTLTLTSSSPNGSTESSDSTKFRMVTENITAFHSPEMVQFLKKITEGMNVSSMPEVKENAITNEVREAETTQMSSEQTTSESHSTNPTEATIATSEVPTGGSTVTTELTSTMNTDATSTRASGADSTTDSQKASTQETTQDQTTTTTTDSSFAYQVNSNFSDMDTKEQIKDNKKYFDAGFGSGSQEVKVTETPTGTTPTSTTISGVETTTKRTSGQTALISNVLLLLVNLVFVKSMNF